MEIKVDLNPINAWMVSTALGFFQSRYVIQLCLMGLFPLHYGSGFMFWLGWRSGSNKTSIMSFLLEILDFNYWITIALVLNGILTLCTIRIGLPVCALSRSKATCSRSPLIKLPRGVWCLTCSKMEFSQTEVFNMPISIATIKQSLCDFNSELSFRLKAQLWITKLIQSWAFRLNCLPGQSDI